MTIVTHRAKGLKPKPGIQAPRNGWNPPVATKHGYLSNCIATFLMILHPTFPSYSLYTSINTPETFTGMVFAYPQQTLVSLIYLVHRCQIVMAFVSSYFIDTKAIIFDKS